METADHCGICNKQANLTLKEKFEEYSLLECAECFGQFWIPMKNPGRDWYEHDERYSFRNKNPLDHIESNHKEFFKDCPLRQGKLLDIGTGTGNFLKAAIDRGYDGYGIDFDREAIDAAKNILGLKNVFVSDTKDILEKFGRNYFDAVTMFEVLEHLEKPSSFISQVRLLLKPQGFLGLSVPYRGSWDVFKKYDKPPRHLTRWDEVSIRNFLSNNNFEVLKTKIIPASQNFIITKFHFWTKGILSFNLTEKVSNATTSNRGPLDKNLLVKITKALAKFKDYTLFLIPSVFLYLYLKFKNRHCLTLYVFARCI